MLWMETSCWHFRLILGRVNFKQEKARYTRSVHGGTGKKRSSRGRILHHLAIGIEHKEQEREFGEYPQSRLDFPPPSRDQLAKWIEHKPGSDSDADVVGEAHQRDHRKRRNQFCKI